MKNKISILLGLSFFLGCITSRDVENLSVDKRNLYPIGENSKWGFANSDGETVIHPIFEKVDFFVNGLASVKSNGKYGFIKKDGSWHIKAKYDSATSFISNCSLVSIKDDTFLIDRKGKKINAQGCSPISDGCRITFPVNPNEFFKKINGKYELEYKYGLKTYSSDLIEVKDTSNFRIDEIFPFGNTHILLKKNGKFGLFDIRSHRRIIVNKNDSTFYENQLNSQLSQLIDFKYDDVIYSRQHEREVSYAKVRIGKKFGVINSKGDQILDIEFDSLEIEPGSQLALVEFETKKYGYKTFDGKEFFKRKKSNHQHERSEMLIK